MSLAIHRCLQGMVDQAVQVRDVINEVCGATRSGTAVRVLLHMHAWPGSTGEEVARLLLQVRVHL